MTDDEPRAHVLRANLPWRPADRTECGRAAADFVLVWTRDQLLAHIKQYGQRRTSFVCCSTCAVTAERWKDWATDPVDVLRREFYTGRTDERMLPELLAIAALIEEHREEFDGYLAGRKETVDLAAFRNAKRTGRR